MKQALGTFFFVAVTTMVALGQETKGYPDTVAKGTVTIHKDKRLDELVRKEASFNEVFIATNARIAKGYRLMLLSTNDRALAMKVRTQLLQRYPDQKVYMSFQPPYIKLKFGNFIEKEEAESYRKEIIKNKLVTTNVYLLPETIEVKPDKNKDKEREGN
jgi:SPOR domain